MKIAISVLTTFLATFAVLFLFTQAPDSQGLPSGGNWSCPNGSTYNVVSNAAKADNWTITNNGVDDITAKVKDSSGTVIATEEIPAGQSKTLGVNVGDTLTLDNDSESPPQNANGNYSN